MPSTAPVSRRRLLAAAAAGGMGVAGASLLGPVAARAAVPPGTTVPTDFPGLAPFGVPSGLPRASMVPDMLSAFDFQALIAFGNAAYGAAEVGEVSTAVGDVTKAAGSFDAPFYDAWVDQFLGLGTALQQRAEAASAAGHTVTARGRHLRAATYFGQALYFVPGTSQPGRETAVYRSARANWDAAAALMTPAFVPVQIPYTGPGGPLPGYYAAAPGPGPKPTLLSVNGSDGQLVDIYCSGGAAALERGFNVLLLEGPGQGSMLFERNVSFRPDWQAVVTPVVDWLVTRPEVDADRIALMGISFGGGLALQAAAHEPRLRAVVSDPGSTTPSAPFQSLDIPDVDFQGYAQSLPATDRAILLANVNKRAEIFGARYHADAVAGRLVDVTGLYATVQEFDLTPATLAAVTMPALVLDYQFEQFFPGQSAQTFAGLTRSPGKQLYIFTREMGAQLHDAPMAPQVHNEVILDWVADRLAEPRPPVPPAGGGQAPQSAGQAPLAATGAKDVAALGVTGAAMVAAGAAAVVAGRTRSTRGAGDQPA